MRILLLLTLALAAASAVPTKGSQRIVGGEVTTISRYPYGAQTLFSWSGAGTFNHDCGGTIINNRAILSAAHCFHGWSAHQFRIRVGSSYANSGGTLHSVSRIINHPNYNPSTVDNDVAVIHSPTAFVFTANVRQGDIAGPNYNVGDNQSVWAIGWGRIAPGGAFSIQLRHVQVWTVNQNTCRSRYAEIGRTITDNMLCSGWLDVGGRDQCQGDSGGPLIHNNVVVGVCSWGQSCALARFPGVNARVQRFSTWIQANA